MSVKLSFELECSIPKRDINVWTFWIFQELQKKREEKQKEIKEKAEEEVRFLQASGKISKKPGNKGRPRSSSSASNKNNQRGTPSAGRRTGSLSESRPQSGMEQGEGALSRDGANVPRPGTASSVGRKVDEIFSVSGHD